MAAEFEEIVMASDALHPEQGGPDPRQGLFGLALGRLVAGSGEGVSVRRRKRAAIELAVGVQRQRLEPDIGRRNHVLGQARGEMRPQRLGPEGDAIRRRCIVSHEPAVAGRVLPREHKGFAHAPMLGEPGLDLAELDPEAADLHLEIVAAEIVDRPVGPESAKVPGPVEPLSRHERIGDEPLGGQLGPVEIAPADLHAANMNLARFADRNRFAKRVENIDPGVRDRTADRNIRRRGPGRRTPGRHLDRGLRRSVEVVQLDSRKPLMEQPHKAGGQRFAAREHAPQAGACRGFRRFEESPHHRGHKVQGGDRLALDGLDEIGRVPVPAGTRHHEPGAGQERPKNSHADTSKLNGVFCRTRSSV